MFHTINSVVSIIKNFDSLQELRSIHIQHSIINKTDSLQPLTSDASLKSIRSSVMEIFVKVVVKSSTVDNLLGFQITSEPYSLQTHRVYSALKRRGNDCFVVASTCNTRGVFVGLEVVKLH